MKNNFIITSLIITCLSVSAFAQLDSVFYQLSTGSVAGGAVQSTDNFASGAFQVPEGDIKVIPNPEGTYIEPPFIPSGDSDLPPYVYFEDPNATQNPQGGNGQTVLLQKFPGIPQTNYYPPDPTIAVGPNHIIACVNSMFTIWDKQGNILKSISAGGWWAPAWPDENGDPQVIYDHFAGRWVLLWMQYNPTALTAGNLIAYSDDDNPLGTWYMFRLDTKTNVPVANWGDYPQIGFDDEAIYIMTRVFGFASGGPFYTKIRIITKSDLYTNSTAGFSYRDLWDIGLPGTPGFKPDGIHPTFSYTPGQGGYLFWASRSGASYYAVYKIVNPTSQTPNLRGSILNVQQYYQAPLAQQLGGGQGLESNGSQMKTSPVIRDGKMYAAHSIANSTNTLYTSAKYVEYDLASNSLVEQVEIGGIGYYYIFPTLTVDKDYNIAMTYTRSALTEYAGGYYSTKLAGDLLFGPSQTLIEGRGNYQAVFNGRNRWGDYLGIYLDPANDYDIWIFPEYVAATNTWGTYVGQIRMVPFAGIYTHLSTNILPFGNVENNTVSDTLEVVVANYGTDDLEITSVASEVGFFTRIPDQNFPQTLQTYDSLTIRVIFSPTELGDFDEILSVSSSDPGFTGIQLTGHSYEIIIPYTDIFYASSGGGNNGDMITIDRTTGEGTTLGPSLYGEIRSLAVNPKNNVLYGLVAGGSNSEIVRVNADKGDAYTWLNLDVAVLTGIDFDTSGTLYASDQIGKIFLIDQNNGNYTLVTTATHALNAIAFNPNTNQLFGALRKTFGNPKDSIYTIDLLTGEATPIGRTGFNSLMTNDMAFDESGKLYGVTGASNQEGQFFEIDQVTGTGTLIGTGVGFNHTVGIAFSINGPIVSVDGENSIIPAEYALKQNYPNPFNPTTKIEFSLPVAADVQLVVFNILGQEVASLINEQKSAGNHSIFWNADDSKGIKLSSGIYLYKLKATGNDGSEFQETRKMILLK